MRIGRICTHIFIPTKLHFVDGFYLSCCFMRHLSMLSPAAGETTAVVVVVPLFGWLARRRRFLRELVASYSQLPHTASFRSPTTGIVREFSKHAVHLLTKIKQMNERICIGASDWLVHRN